MISREPETVTQAIKWESSKNHYVRAGLCYPCACQAAWAHQEGAGGFAAAHPPCDSCQGLDLPAWLTARHGTRGARWLLDGHQPA